MDMKDYEKLVALCESLEEVDAIMDKASADPDVANGDFISLCVVCRQKIWGEGWLK